MTATLTKRLECHLDPCLGHPQPAKDECTDRCKCLCDLCVIFGVHKGQGHDKPEGRVIE